MSAKPSPYTPSAYVAICKDGPNGSARRAAASRDHFKYIESVLGELNLAGPLYAPDSKTMIGSLYCLQTASLDKARSLVEEDPFFRAGVFASVDYYPHLPAAGKFIGGKIW